MQIEKFGVEDWMNTYEEEAKFNIAETCVEPLTVGELLDMGGERESFYKKLSEKRLTYGAIPGSPELRAEICSLYCTEKKPENVLVTNGGIGANFLALFSLLRPGDEVVALYPTYQQLYSLPEALRAKVRRLRLEPAEGFMPDMEKLRTLITPNTKLIVLNTPNNPTGALFGEETLRGVAGLADRAGAWVLCDEIYRGLEHAASYKIPSIADIYDRGIGTSSMSKVYSAAGLRLGWITAREDFIAECFKHRDYNIISCGVIDDMLAVTALRNKEKILRRNLAIVKENAAIVDEWVNRTPGLSYVKPLAGTTALIKYDMEIASTEFCRGLYEYNGAFVVPGACFEFENCFRLGYAPERETLLQGLRAVGDYLQTLR